MCRLSYFLTENVLATWQRLVQDSVMHIRHFKRETFQMH